MRIYTAILIASCAASSGYANEIDPDDHASLCAQMAQAHDWPEGSNAVLNCQCSMAELQKLMAPELFLTTLKWQLDPAALPNILPVSMSVANFYDTVGPAFGAVESVCGPMR